MSLRYFETSKVLMKSLTVYVFLLFGLRLGVINNGLLTERIGSIVGIGVRFPLMIALVLSGVSIIAVLLRISVI